jgi:hypothetical protein
VDPQHLIIGGFVTLAAGALILLSFGPRYRVGRLLATTPKSTIEAARAAAGARQPVYLRLDGRIDSNAEFEDADHRPLVLRRTRVQVRRGRGWVTVENGRELVPFSLDAGLESIGIDGEARDAGLGVIPREAAGQALTWPIEAGTPAHAGPGRHRAGLVRRARHRARYARQARGRHRLGRHGPALISRHSNRRGEGVDRGRPVAGVPGAARRRRRPARRRRTGRLASSLSDVVRRSVVLAALGPWFSRWGPAGRPSRRRPHPAWVGGDRAAQEDPASSAIPPSAVAIGLRSPTPAYVRLTDRRRS